MSVLDVLPAANGVSNVLLAVPQLLNAISQGGYLPKTSSTSFLQNLIGLNPALIFHYEGEQTAILESEITDNFVEDNTSLQDQISLKPEIITTHGFIGELNDVLPGPLAAAKVAAAKLTSIQGYNPSLSATALVQLNTAILAYETAQTILNAGVSALSSLAGIGGESTINSGGIEGGFNPSLLNLPINISTQTKQQQYFTLFYGYWRQRTLFKIQTPWAVFDNMAIKSLRAVQDADTRMITDFEVSFKMIRFAETTSQIVSNLSGRLANQSSASNPVDAGVTNPNNTSDSFLSKVA